jgi:hypothetical protein
MYAITHHHDYDEVLLGPIEWKPRFIASVLQQDLDLDQSPTILPSDESKVPYDILPNVRVRKVEVVYEEHNPKIQHHNGPFWSYENDIALATYKTIDKPLDLVKSELKALLAAERYKKEISGVKTTIQGLEVTVDTNRGDRDVFVQKYLLMSDIDTVEWKFPERWLTLTKSDLGQVVNVGATHVQDCFSWEASKVAEIDSCITLEQLDAIVIEEHPINQENIE